MSDLVEFCDSHGLDDIVVNETWFQRNSHASTAARREGD
jgi:hypothetical protein